MELDLHHTVRTDWVLLHLPVRLLLLLLLLLLWRWWLLLRRLSNLLWLRLLGLRVRRPGAREHLLSRRLRLQGRRRVRRWCTVEAASRRR